MGTSGASRPWGASAQSASSNPPGCVEVLGGNDSRIEALLLSGLEILVVAFPASGQSGGDLYCIHSCGDRTLVKMALADITGHGQRSASIAREIHQLFHLHALEAKPGQLLADVNRQFNQFAPRGVLATSLCAVYATRDGSLHYAYGGQPKMLFWQQHRHEWSTLEPSRDSLCGLPFGVSLAGCYEEDSISLHPGDILLMFSDGVLETRSASGTLLQCEGVLRLAQECMGAMRPGFFPLPVLAEAFLQRLRQFRGRASFEDDITLLWARRLPGTASPASMSDKQILQKE